MATLIKIYISALDREKEFLFDRQALELLQQLPHRGFELYWVKKWRDYEIIEREIAACSALLAIVDEYWLSSTWMTSEVTWASGDCGAIHSNNFRIKPIPVFLYPVIEKEKMGWLRTYSYPIMLDREVDTALFQITSFLSKS